MCMSADLNIMARLKSSPFLPLPVCMTNFNLSVSLVKSRLCYVHMHLHLYMILSVIANTDFILFLLGEWFDDHKMLY